MAHELAGEIGKDIAKGGTVEDIMRRMNSHLPEGDGERLFYDWILDNKGRIREACADLGVECPETGPQYTFRLKLRVKPVLVQRYKEEHGG